MVLLRVPLSVSLAAAVLVALAPAAPATAAARTCLVKKFQYANNGGYKVTALRVETPKAFDQRKGKVYRGETRTIDIGKWKQLTEGQEVWLSYKVMKLYAEEKESCRKDGTKLIYDPDKGNT